MKLFAVGLFLTGAFVHCVLLAEPEPGSRPDAEVSAEM